MACDQAMHTSSPESEPPATRQERSLPSGDLVMSMTSIGDECSSGRGRDCATWSEQQMLTLHGVRYCGGRQRNSRRLWS
jgi:hypothetical protein